MTAPTYWADSMAMLALCASVLRQAQDDVSYAITAGWISPETLEETAEAGAKYYQNARPSRDDAMDAVLFLQSADADAMCAIVNELAGREMVSPRYLLDRAVRNATDPQWHDRDPMVGRLKRDRATNDQTFFRVGENPQNPRLKRKPWRAMKKMSNNPDQATPRRNLS